MSETDLPQQKVWSHVLRKFLNETPDGARFLLSYFGKPLTSYTAEEWAKLQSQWEKQAKADLPKYLQETPAKPFNLQELAREIAQRMTVSGTISFGEMDTTPAPPDGPPTQ